MGMDAAEMNDYEYQPGRFRCPVWVYGDQYLTVATPGELKRIDLRDPTESGAAHWDWVPAVFDPYASRMAAAMAKPRIMWVTRMAK